MNASLDLPFIRAAAALRAYGQNRESSARWMHRSWIEALLGGLNAGPDTVGFWTEALARASDTAVKRVSVALCHSAGIEAPPLEALSQPALLRHGARTEGAVPNAALLDIVPSSLGMQIVCMRALSFRRAEVRRLIDKRTRSGLSALAGVSVDVLGRDAHLADAPDVVHLQTRAGMPPIATLDSGTLQVEGLALLMRDLGAASTSPFPLFRCALPRDMPEPAWLAAVPREVDSLGTERLFSRLPELLPEWSWLFG